MFQIVCETLIEGDGFTRDRIARSRLPNTYETSACAWKIAERVSADRAAYCDDILYVVPAGTSVRLPSPAPVVVDDFCPF